jgi:hypothetical protein
MLHLDNLSFRYDPFPIGYARPVLDPGLYSQLVNAWPDTSLFVFKENLGRKYSLSEVNGRDVFLSFLRRSPVWADLYRFIKSEAFIHGVAERLRQLHVDLGLQGRRVSKVHALSTVAQRCRAGMERVTRLTRSGAPLAARFEFSMMPSNGGFIKPHTDAPQKLITLVISMIRDEEWLPEWGGGTSTLRPKDMSRSFNQMNAQYEFNDMEPLETFPFVPNQCVVFVKTFNSFHAVFPTSGPANRAMRKTLTINIESWGT